MKLIVCLLLICSPFFYLSCKDEKADKQTKQQDQKQLRIAKASIIKITDSVFSACNSFIQDSVNSIGAKGIFTADDYPVTYDMLSKNYYATKVIGEFLYGDAAWFTNDSLKQVLIITIATDLYRMKMLNFSYSEFPDELLSEIDIYRHNDYGSDSVNNFQKKTALPEFIDSAKKLTSFYFTTVRGFKLGDCKEKALKVYGNPHKRSLLKDIEKCEWIYDGDELYKDEGEKVPSNKLIAKNSFGHTVTMYFRNNRLIALKFFNDIP
jgi:hypothetical protein